MSGLAAGVLAMAAMSAGCEDSCADLQVICDDCLDPNQRAACEAAVDRDDQQDCSQEIESYQEICQ